MLNNFALCKISPEITDEQDPSDQVQEKVMIHSDPFATPTGGERWTVRRKSSAWTEELESR